MRLFVAFSLSALMLAGCAGDTQDTTTTTTTSATTTTMDHTPKTYQVSLTGNAFVNDTLTLKTGDAVVWTHNDGATNAHTVTSGASDPETFDSSPQCAAGIPVSAVCMTEGETFQHVFQTAGLYSVRCKVHSGMTQSITVVAHNATA